jgi:hypothetical protein
MADRPVCAVHQCALVRKPWPLPFGCRAAGQPLVCLPCVAAARAKVHAAMRCHPQGRARLRQRGIAA